MSRYDLFEEESSVPEDVHRFREEALTYLKDEGIVKDYEIHYSEYASHSVDVTLDIDKFLRFKKEIRSHYNKKYPKPAEPKRRGQVIFVCVIFN